MKSLFVGVLGLVAGSLSALAAPTMVIDAVISQRDGAGQLTAVAAPKVVVESGKEAVIQHGRMQYAVTPNLLENGTVVLSVVISEQVGKVLEKRAEPRLVVDLDRDGLIDFGGISISVKPSLAP
jgi:hypothetical protein